MGARIITPLRHMSVKDLFDLSGTVALVTGGSRGLGLEMAAGLGEAGAAVAITARRGQGLTSGPATLAGMGIDCFPTACDVTQPNEVDATVAAVIARFGRLDILVNNAGVSW